MSEDGNVGLGLGACAVAIVLFGSNYVPLRKVNTGDGIFAQWAMCLGVICTGVVVGIIEPGPFFPLAMLGGVFWALGNALTVAIVNEIGMALGLLLWSTTNLLMGWASGRFGLFGLAPEVSTTVRLRLFNYLGVIFTALRAMGLALCCGIFMGNTFNPVIYMQDHTQEFEGASKRGLPYVFAQFCGIFATGTAVFICYAVYKQVYLKQSPDIPQEAFLPSFIAGSMWAVAQCAYFVANTELTEAGSYPIISTTPNLVGTVWGVLYFKEIQGKRNQMILVAGFVVLLVGKVFATLSVVLLS